MRNKHIGHLILCAAACITLSGCVDERYDLTNLDNTMEIKVNNLTLPIAIDPVEFGDMVDLNEDESIKTNENGEYYFEKEGEFSSGNFTLAAFTAAASTNTFATGGYKIGKGLPAGKTVSFAIGAISPTEEEKEKFQLKYAYNNVDKSIYDITEATVDMTISVSINLPKCNVAYDEIKMVMPKGATGIVLDQWGDPYTGSVKQNGNQLTFTNIDAPDGTFAFKFQITKLNFKEAGGSIVNPKNGSPASFTLTDNYIYLESVTLTTKADISTDSFLRTNFTLSNIRIQSISGQIKYDIDNFAMICVLDNVPNELSGNDTQIAFSATHLKLALKNPLGKFGAANAHLKIEQVRDNTAEYLPQSARSVETDITLPAGQEYTNLTLYYGKEPEHTNADIMKEVPNFGNILLGKGLPKELKVTFPDVLSNVNNLTLGDNTEYSIGGNYWFEAPFSLTNNSHVVYSHRQDNWDMNGNDNLTIYSMIVSADVESTLPANVSFKASPIQRSLLNNGYKGVNKNVTIQGAQIQNGNHPIKITINFPQGITISDLMGLDYTVEVNSDGKGAINKNQGLKFNNLKVTVSGKYTSKD